MGIAGGIHRFPGAGIPKGGIGITGRFPGGGISIGIIPSNGLGLHIQQSEYSVCIIR